mmetsp:Transcript_90291/g.184130  ORF Transcript_90291/g.184130 Transcript_90291/m.184130 type:complete len:272 (+) Transcript_90291:613-1428(+)
MDKRVSRISVFQSSQMREGWTSASFVDIRKRFSSDNIFTSLTRVRLSSNAVDGDSKGLVSFTTEGSKRHGTGTETLHDFGGWFDIFNRNTFTVGIKVEKISDVSKRGIFEALLKNFVVGNALWLHSIVWKFISLLRGADGFVKTNGIVQQLRKIGRVGMVFSQSWHRLVVSVVDKLLSYRFRAHHDSFGGNVLETKSTNTTGRPLEASADDFVTKTNRFENLGPRVRSEQRNSDLRQNLQQTVFDGGSVVFLSLGNSGFLEFAVLHHLLCS